MINRSVSRQFMAVVAGSLSIMNLGIIAGWTSPVMKELLEPGSPIPMTVEESSWFASLHNWGLIVGSLPSGMIADRWGRKPVLLFVGPTLLATWVTLLYVDTFRGLIAVRLVQGMLAGGAYTVVPLYVSEIAGPEIRGALGAIFTIMLYLGVLFVYVAGMYLDYKQLTVAAIAGPVLCCAVSAAVTESPYFYVMKERLAEARRTLAWLRGDNGDGTTVDAEMNTMVGCISAEMRGASFTDLFTDLVNVRSLMIVLCLAVFRAMAGIQVIVSYASVTFAEMHVDVSANKLSLVFACSLLFSALPTSLLADRVDRRTLMITSSLSCFACNAVVCAYFYADQRTGYEVTAYGWLCVAAMGGLCVAFNLGFGSLYSTINCELFPSNARSAANAFSSIVLTAVAFASTKAFPVLTERMGMFLNFFIFSAFSLSSAAFCWLWLPETRGKTFAAIQQQLRGITDRTAA